MFDEDLDIVDEKFAKLTSPATTSIQTDRVGFGLIVVLPLEFY